MADTEQKPQRLGEIKGRAKIASSGEGTLLALGKAGHCMSGHWREAEAGAAGGARGPHTLPGSRLPEAQHAGLDMPLRAQH